MRRRVFLGAIGAAMAGSTVVSAQQKVERIAILAGDIVAPHEEEALVKGLREQGLIEGQNLIIERRYANGRLDLVPQFARELAGLKLTAVVSTCTPTTRAAQQAFGTSPDSTPIVMAAVADPVGQRIIASLARPGANVTGLASQADDILSKKLGLFAEILPAKATVAVLMDGASDVHPNMWQALEPVAARLFLRLVQVQAGRKPGMASLPDAFGSAATKNAKAVFVLSDEPFFFARRDEIAALAALHRFPAFYGQREFVDAGGLMSYGESMTTAYRSVASYISRIVEGAKPRDLPVSQPTTFEFVINMRTAKALDLSLPPDFVARADDVIE
jgi:putative ABC transport system substrate-binding protein